MKISPPKKNSHRRRLLPVLLAPVMFLLSIPLHSQTDEKPYTDDAQIWENFNVDKKLSRSFTARFSHEGRFTNNDSRFTYYFEDVGMEYKLHKLHLGILLDYVFIQKEVQRLGKQFWSTRHQYYAALTWGKDFGPVELHDRQMLMGQVKDVYSSATGKIPDWYLRNKFTVKYNFNFYWSLYAAEELYWHVNEPQPDALPHVNRMRYFFGGYYRPNKRSEFELYYLVEQHMNIVNANHNFVLGLGYGLTL